MLRYVLSLYVVRVSDDSTVQYRREFTDPSKLLVLRLHELPVRGVTFTSHYNRCIHLCTAGSHMQYYDSLMCIKHSQYAAYTEVQDRRQHNTNKAREECLGQFFKKCSLGDEYFSDGVFPRH